MGMLFKGKDSKLRQDFFGELCGELGIRGKIRDLRYRVKMLERDYEPYIPAHMAWDFEGICAALDGAERYVSLLGEALSSSWAVEEEEN